MPRMIPLLVIFASAALWTGCASKQSMTHFGEPMQVAATETPITVGELIANAEKYEGQTVLVKGTITAMCTGSGCWVQVAQNPDDPEEDQIVAMFIYDQATHGRVPGEAKGQRAILQGKVKFRVITEVERKHYAEVDGKSADEIALIKGSKKRVTIDCPAIEVAGVQKAEVNACPHDHDHDTHDAQSS